MCFSLIIFNLIFIMKKPLVLDQDQSISKLHQYIQSISPFTILQKSTALRSLKFNPRSLGFRNWISHIKKPPHRFYPIFTMSPRTTDSKHFNSKSLNITFNNLNFSVTNSPTRFHPKDMHREDKQTIPCASNHWGFSTLSSTTPTAFNPNSVGAAENKKFKTRGRRWCV